MVNAKKRILIIEDDEMLRTMYKTKLEADGYDILTAENGEEGLKMAKKEDVDMVLLDVILPGLDGFSVLQELKDSGRLKKFPVIMLTNLGTDEDKEKGEKLGAKDYFVKSNLTPDQVSEGIVKYLK